MDEDKKRVWDVRLGIAAPVLTVIGIIVGVWQFNAGEEHRRQLELDSVVQKDKVDFNRRLWLERLNAYRSVAELAGKIVAHAGDDQFKNVVNDFMAAYWGTMILVEDKGVEGAMIRFYVEFQDFEDGWSDINRLKVRADDLIAACRRSAESGSVGLL